MGNMDEPKYPTKSRLSLLIPVIFLATFGLLLFRNGDKWLRNILVYLSQASWARQMISNWSIAWLVASRFVAGEDRQAAVEVGRVLNENGLLVTLDYLGESVSTEAEAFSAREEIMRILEDINEHQLNANVSLKPSQLGLKLDPALAQANITAIVQKAQQYGNFIRIDMEDHPTTDETLSIYQHIRQNSKLDNVGVVIQSYLYRSEKDIEHLIDVKGSVRLCKGAYAEPGEVAFPKKFDVDANYLNLSRMMLSPKALANGVRPAFATHDPRMIDEIIQYTKAHNISNDKFEFQMLYGIRRDLQESLTKEGYQVRVYVPYGTAWYPYFVRRLAERPANLWFFISNFFRA